MKTYSLRRRDVAVRGSRIRGAALRDSRIASKVCASKSAFPAWPSPLSRTTKSRWRKDSASSGLGSPDPVDADTIFPTGSTGKAFTVAALGILVDQGKIAWDDKVIDHLPGFQMYDPWVTREMTIRDLLVHRSGLGLGAGDLLFVPRTNLSRAESVRRLRYIKPATSFRSAYAYDNILYMVAGQLIEDVTGETWEKFTAEPRAQGGRNAALDHG